MKDDSTIVEKKIKVENLIKSNKNETKQTENETKQNKININDN